MKTFEIFITDLTEEAQKRLIEELDAEDNNWDVFPLAMIDIEEDIEA